LEEVAVHAGHKVMIEVDDLIVMIVCDGQGILDQQLRPHPIHLFSFIFVCYKKRLFPG